MYEKQAAQNSAQRLISSASSADEVDLKERKRYVWVTAASDGSATSNSRMTALSDLYHTAIATTLRVSWLAARVTSLSALVCWLLGRWERKSKDTYV